MLKPSALAALLVLFPALTAFALQDPSSGTRRERILASDLAIPARAPAGFARSDTISFGYVQQINGGSYAVLGEKWTFDHGTPSLEGWTSIDETVNHAVYFRQITSGAWAGHGNTVAAPIIDGAGSAWIGAFEDEARALCWAGGLGYGNLWCQRLTSPDYAYSGSGDVQLSFSYFEDSEFKFDYGKVFVAVGGSRTQLNGPGGFSGLLGTPPSGPWASYSTTISEAALGGAGDPRPFSIAFEFVSDGGWSDEDGYYLTVYGPLGIDDVHLEGSLSPSPADYGFEAGLEGWTPSVCPGMGSFMAIHPLSLYSNITFPACCGISGTVLAFHESNMRHSYEWQEAGYSPPVDRTGYQGYNKILCDWDQYSDLPMLEGVDYRPGWSYYPWICPQTGQQGWSPRVGTEVWRYTGDTPVCEHLRDVATDWGVPSDCQQIRFVYEVYATCDVFQFSTCAGEQATNVTPLIDNLQIRMTSAPAAPVVGLDVLDAYIDGFPHSGDGPFGLGNADIARCLNTYPGSGAPPYRMGDSLVVLGPTPTASTRWDAKMWWRVRREGPAQVHIAAYNAWKAKVADGRQIVGENGAFTWGWMDSVETGTVSKIRRASYFREDDDDYTPGPAPTPDINPNNEMIPDGILTPGTKIEYFVTANYICTPTVYSCYPDTTGKNHLEFEILPGYQTDYATGFYRFPCLLWVNAGGATRGSLLERSLNMALTGVPAAISGRMPDPAPWDRYDYQIPTSIMHAPMIRNGGGGNGAEVYQLFGYHMIIMDTGGYPTGATSAEDWAGLDTWLTSPLCAGNVTQQGFWATGDHVAEIISSLRPSFLDQRLGASFLQNVTGRDACTRLEQAGSCAWDPGIDLDLSGSCQDWFDQIGATGSGCGARLFQLSGNDYSYAQVVNDQTGSSENYRAVLDGYAASRLVQRGGGGSLGECAYDSTRALSAVYEETENVLKWTLGLADPRILGYCEDPCIDEPLGVPAGPDAGPVNRLIQNRPNPFNPSTTIRYSLARDGPATLAVYDLGGRRVKVLAQGPLSAGPHVVVWDGLDEAGHKVPAGVYWSQLTAGSFTSNKKMIVIR